MSIIKPGQLWKVRLYSIVGYSVIHEDFKSIRDFVKDDIVLTLEPTRTTGIATSNDRYRILFNEKIYEIGINAFKSHLELLK